MEITIASILFAALLACWAFLPGKSKSAAAEPVAAAAQRTA